MEEKKTPTLLGYFFLKIITPIDFCFFFDHFFKDISLGGGNFVYNLG